MYRFTSLVVYVSDESLLGGLSLLLMAGQHVTAPPLLNISAAAAAADDAADDAKRNISLLTAATVGRLDAAPHHPVSSLFVSISNCCNCSNLSSVFLDLC